MPRQPMNSQMNIQMNTHLILMLTNEQASSPYQRGKQPGVRETKRSADPMRKEEYLMNFINKLIVKVRESKKGQTMTEYVLIIAAIAVAGYTAYVGLEGGINNIIANVTHTLTSA
jgi:Flp pilus assembly pilin Flp